MMHVVNPLAGEVYTPLAENEDEWFGKDIIEQIRDGELSDEEDGDESDEDEDETDEDDETDWEDDFDETQPVQTLSGFLQPDPFSRYTGSASSVPAYTGGFHSGSAADPLIAPPIYLPPIRFPAQGAPLRPAPASFGPPVQQFQMMYVQENH